LKQLLFIFSLFVLISCRTKNKESNEPTIATAGEKDLKADEFKQLGYINESKKDSAIIAQRMIERWAQDELFYQEAKQKLAPEDLNVDAEVEKYRKELINYKYEVKLIENNLDTAISQEEITRYYDDNQDNFILKDNIVKVNYLKIPVVSKALDKVKKCIYSFNPKDKEVLVNLCAQYADNYFFNDSTWLLLEDVKKEIPQLKDLPEYNFYAGRIFEYRDTLNYYYLKIKEVKVKNNLSPINFERKNIKNILVNQRKMKLIKQYKVQIFDKAKGENRFKIGPNKEEN
jgi:hypothetical protein